MIKKLLFLLVLLLTATTTWAQAQTYKVTLQEGTEDAKKWTVPAEAAEGATVTATYSGSRKVKSVKAVDPMLATPMTIEAITAGSINVANPKEGMQYSKNGGAKTAVTTDAIDVAEGDKVQFYGNGTSITSYGSNLMSECTMITGSGDGFTCKVYGNIMSLVDEENFAKAKTLSDKYTFKFLFLQNTTLTDASGLLLPAATLQESCYRSMFDGCTALTAAPALPATQLAMHCYREMFNSCYALTAAPVLPATKLVMYCYFSMFNYCKKLATVTCLATSGINQDYSTSYWLDNAGTDVQGTKTVYTVSTANWPVDNNGGIPTGWTLVNIGAQSTEPTEWELTSQDGKVWTLAKMPANDIELQVEYFAESNLFLSKDALANKANISVLNGQTAVEFDDEGKSTTTVTEGNTVTAKFTGKKVLGVKAEKKGPVVYPMAAEATAADYGKVVCAAGHLHDAKTAVPKGCTAVAVFAYIDGSNNRYGIALQNAASKATWNTITSNGANKNKLCNVPGTWTVPAPTGAEWKVATKAIYEAMFINLGSTKSDSDGTTYDANVNAFITTGVGGTAISGDFWSTTEKSSTDAWCFRTQYWDFYGKSDIDCNVRPVLVW